MNGELTSLFELPNGWVWTRLGEMALEPQYGWTTSAADTGALRLLRTTDITSGYVDWGSVPFCQDEPPDVAKYLLHDKDIVISRAGSVGYSYLIKNPPEAVFASYLIRFRPLIDAAYFGLFLKSPMYWEAILEKSIGIALANVNASKLKQIHVPLPPLPEQHRIVAKIEELFTRLDAGVESIRKIKAQVKRYRQSVLKQAFEGRLTEEWRQAHQHELEPASILLECIRKERQQSAKGKYKELLPLDTHHLPKLPEGWVWTITSAVCSSVRDGTHDTPKYIEEGIPLVTSKNLRENGLDFTTARNISIEDHKKISVRSGVDAGDILFAMIGTIGNPVVVRTNKTFSIKNVGLFKKNEAFLDSEYLGFWLTSQVFREILEEKKLLKGTTQKFIPLEHLRILPVPLTSRLEQHRIVEEIERRFSVADQIEKTIDHSLGQAARLRQSILKRAFEGKLVPQDPNDEPAEKLLERVREDRAKPQATVQPAKVSRKRVTTEEMRLL